MRSLADALFVVDQGGTLAAFNAVREAGQVLGTCCSPVGIIPAL